MSAVAMVELRTEPRIENDEEGLLRAVTPPEAIGVRVRYIVGLSTPNATRAAWAINPACANCHESVERPKDAALVITANKEHRIAHRGSCFIAACVAAHPALTTGSVHSAHHSSLPSQQARHTLQQER